MRAPREDRPAAADARELNSWWHVLGTNCCLRAPPNFQITPVGRDLRPTQPREAKAVVESGLNWKMKNCCRALLVEDNQVMRDALIPVMAELAAVEVVACAEKEQDALIWLITHRRDIDVVILDMKLQEGSGLGVLHGIRGMRLDCVVVMLTNFGTSELRARCAQAGANAFFDKAEQTEEFLDYMQWVAPWMTAN